MIKATVISLRRGPKTQNPYQCIIRIDGVKDRSEVTKYIGRKVVLKLPKGEVRGTIVSPHGNSGCARVVFKRGLTGYVIGNTLLVEV